MAWLVSGAAFFLLIHLGVSGTRVRDALVSRMGDGPYMGVFSLASLVGLAWLGWGYAVARGSAADPVFWNITSPTRHIALGLQAIAFLFIVPGLMTKNPTSVRQEGALDDAEPVRGMLRITRHPFLWGVAIWAAGHLLVNGDLASVILFATLLMLALVGTRSIAAKRARAFGERWAAFRAKSSNVPFAAIMSGRQSLRLGEIGAVRIGAAVVAYLALLFAHPYLFGVNPLG